MRDLKIKTADEIHGYSPGCDGWMDATEARKHLMNISWKTLQRLVEEGHIRKGKIPGGNKTGYCRRSIQNLSESMEV